MSKCAFSASSRLLWISSKKKKVGFYGNSCGSSETIVKDEVRKGFYRDQGVAAGLVRLHFHDCFVKGCDGSVLVDSTPGNSAEKDSPANDPSLQGYEVIDSAKARLEAMCKGVVSCADIVAFAARDSIVITGGLGYEVPAGRRDGRISQVSETFTNLPPPTINVDRLTQAFAKKGFTQEEMVTLTGAHTIGRSHCTSFSDRLYNFNGTTSHDPSLDPMYASQLMLQCPQGNTNPNLVVPMDPSSPATTDSGHYTNILANRGLFTSDQKLLTNAATVIQVNQNAWNVMLWRSKFVSPMLKMGQLDVLTGNAGEIRSNCREPRSDAAAKAGSFDSKSSCGYEVQHSDNICEPQKDHASLSKSTGDMYLKPSLKMQHLKVSTVTSEKKHSSETCVVDAGSNRNDPSRYGTSKVPSIHGTEDALSSPASVEDASAKLTKLHKADSTPKIDVPMLVNTIHNLSDLLLFHSSNGSFELKEGDREALKDVILNLHRCLSKYSEQKIPTPESLFPQQGTSQYLAQLSEMFELY
uniref:peroxidase n=1 Tax=Fagus sylvatica TaxID=28930 RepID=A0A2N9I155_FAGSY